MRGTKALKDTDICILKDQAWGSGALVPPWLDDLLFESLHARKQQRWTVTLFVWQKKGPLGSCASWSRWMFLATVGIRVGAKTASCCSTEFWAKTILPIQTLVVSSATESRLLAP